MAFRKETVSLMASSDVPTCGARLCFGQIVVKIVMACLSVREHF